MNNLLLVSLALVATVCKLVQTSPIEGGTCYPESNHLPENIYPVAYNLDIKPNFEKQTFTGSVIISLHVEKTSAGRFSRISKLFCSSSKDCNKSPESPAHRKNVIVFHADQAIDIKSVEYMDLGYESNSKRSEMVPVKKVCRDLERQLVAVELSKDLKSDAVGKLFIEYSAKIRDDMRGFYRTRSAYRPEHDTYATQFEGSNIRLAVPSLDEPRFRSTVELTVRVNSDIQLFGSAGIVSTDKQRDIRTGEEVFTYTKKLARTEPIQLNSFAFAIGGIYRSYREYSVHRYVSVLHDSGCYAAIDTVLDDAVATMQWLSESLGRHAHFPEEEFSIMALATHNTGSTGSWSMATIKDELIALGSDYDPRNRVAAAFNVARVSIQQWFGGVISMGRWTDMWVTEGLSTYLAHEALDAIQPGSPAKALARVSSFARDLELDATGQRPPLSPGSVETASEIDEVYQRPTSSKGVAIMAMLNSLIGREAFEAGLKSLLPEYGTKVATSEDFIAALETSSGNPKLKEVIFPWIKLSGFPLINVESSGERKISLHQEPYYKASDEVDGSKPRSFDSLWTVPLSLYFSDSQTKSQSMPVVLAASNEATVIDAPHWFDLSKPGHFVQVDSKNYLSAFYRVRYSSTLMDKLTGSEVKQNSLSPMSKLNLLDDTAHLSRDGKVSRDTFRDLIGSHEHETSPEVMLGLLKAAKELNPSDLGEAFKGKKNPFLELWRADRLKPAANLADEIARQEVFKSLVESGDEEVMKLADENWSGDMASYLKPAAFAAVVKRGDTAQVNELLGIPKALVPSDLQLRAAQALALSKDATVLRGLMDWVSKDFSYRRFDTALSIVNLIRGNEAGAGVLGDHTDIIKVWEQAAVPAISSGVRGEGNL